jgi:cobalt-zinc-cadmium efflux system protein
MAQDHHDHDHHGHDGHGHAGHSHAGHDHSHGATDKTRVLIAAVLTGGFMIAEAIGGVVTGSLALIADAGHMLTDSIALWLAWYAFRLADRPATVRMTYGFGRVKTLVAYTNGITIFAIAVWICYEAVLRFMDPPPVLGGPMLVVAVLGLLVNVAGFLVLHGGDRTSLNMRGALLHVVGDMLGSAAAIVAAIVIIATGWTPIDPILSVLVALLILRSAWTLVGRSWDVLMEGTPEGLDVNRLRRELTDAVPGVEDVHHVHAWCLTPERPLITFHASLGADADHDEVLRRLRAELVTRFNIEHSTIQLESNPCAASPPCAASLCVAKPVSGKKSA